MSFQPNTMDGGATVGTRTHPLNDPLRARVKDDAVWIDTRHIHVIELHTKDVGDLRTFDAFKRGNPIGSMYESLFQLQMQTLRKMRYAYDHEIDKSKLSHNHYPFQVFIECVMSNEDGSYDRLEDAEQEGTDLRRQLMRIIYDLDDEQFTREMCEITRKMRDGKPLTAFMDGHEARRVVSWRIWVLGFEIELSFPQHMCTLLDFARQKSYELTERTALECDNRRDAQVTSDAQTNGARMSAIVGDNDRWMVLSGVEQWLDLCATYTREPMFLDADVRSQCMGKQGLAHPNNLANPATIFSLANCFRRNRPVIDTLQNDPARYFQRQDGHEYFRFARPECVVELSSEKQTVQAARRLYTPNYQARVVQPCLSTKHFQTTLPRHISVLGSVDGRSNSSLLGPDDLGPVDDNEFGSDDDGDMPIGGGGGRLSAPAVDHRTALINEISRSHGGIDASQVQLSGGRRVGENSGAAQSSIVDTTLSKYEQQRLAAHDFGDAMSRARSANAMRSTTNVVRGNGNALTSKHAVAAQRRVARSEITDEKERAFIYTSDQDSAFTEYMKTCVEPSSDTTSMSAPMAAINQYLQVQQEEGHAHFRDCDTQIEDAELSTFGTMMARRVLELESLYDMFALHREYLFLEFALSDTYRHEYDLHFNPLGTGPPTTGKSFIVDLLHTGQSIPDTVCKVSGVTAAADRIATDNDDMLEFYEETPEVLIRLDAGIGGSNTLLDSFKDRLSSQCTNTKSFVWDKSNGNSKATNEIRRSSQIGGVVCLTNMSARLLAPPIRARFAVMEIRDIVLDGKTRGGMKSDEKTRVSTRAQDRCTREFRLMQALTMTTWKMIFTGVLSPVSTPVLSVYQPIVESVLRDEYGIKVDSRDILRIGMVVKNLVIREALWRLYRHKASPCYGKDIKHEHLKTIDPWLKDHQELVLWAISFMLPVFFPPSRSIFLHTLRKKNANDLHKLGYFKSLEAHEKTRVSRTAKNYFSTIQKGKSNKNAQTQAPAQTQQQQQQLSNAPPPKKTKTAGGLELVPAGSKEAETYDWNYVRFIGKPSDLAGWVSAQTTGGKTVIIDATQAAEQLDELKSVQMTTHPYKQNVNYGVPGSATAKYPVVPDITKPKITLPAIAFDEFKTAVFVCSALIFRKDDDPFASILKRCRDRHSPSAKFLSGAVYSPKTPHLFGTYNMTPNPRKIHVRCSTGGVDSAFSGSVLTVEERRIRDETQKSNDIPLWLKDNAYGIDMPIDQYATRVRAHVISLPLSSATAKVFDPRHTDAYVRNRKLPDKCQLIAISERKNYPRDFLGRSTRANKVSALAKRLESRTPASLDRKTLLTADDGKDPVAEKEQIARRGNSLMNILCGELPVDEESRVAPEQQTAKRTRVAPVVDASLDFAAMFEDRQADVEAAVETEEGVDDRLGDFDDITVDEETMREERARNEYAEKVAREKDYAASISAQRVVDDIDEWSFNSEML